MSPSEEMDQVLGERRFSEHEGIANENVPDVLLLQISFPSYSGLLKPRYGTAALLLVPCLTTHCCYVDGAV